mgnify:FL=1
MNRNFTPVAIETGLWLGRAPAAPEDFAMLRDLGVQDVLTLQTEEEASGSGILPSLAFGIAMAHGMALHRVGIPDLSPTALKALAGRAAGLLLDLRRRQRRVFVHCAVGLNRSPTVVAAYLALSRGMDPDDACRYVKDRHRCAPDRDAVEATLR